MTAVVISGALIFTTIQAQDFPDVEGDAASGRKTIPLYAPEFSRLFTFSTLVAWSIGLGWYWNVDLFSQTAFVSLGLYVGLRYYLQRTVEADRKSYIVFNVSSIYFARYAKGDHAKFRYGYFAHICCLCTLDLLEHSARMY